MTTTTTKHFPAGTSREVVEAEKRLLLQAGAIDCVISGSESNGWTVTATWEDMHDGDD